MFTVLAINSGDSRDLASRRERYNCASFAHALALDRHTGTVTLEPENRVLVVGSGHEEYESVRVFTYDGTLVGLMRRSTDGSVTWTEPRPAGIPKGNQP